jgi:hypothetical protein
MMDSATGVRAASPRAITVIGIFLAFGACMAALAGITLTWRGTALDKAWALNETAYKQLAPGRVVGALFLLLSSILVVAAVGWFKRRLWGWGLAVGIIATQVAGDIVNLVKGDLVRGATGFTIAGLLLFYLLQPRVRLTFR